MQVFCPKCKEWLRVAPDGDGTLEGAVRIKEDHKSKCLGDIGVRFAEITSHLTL